MPRPSWLMTFAMLTLFRALTPLAASAQCPTAVIYEPTGNGSADAGWNGIEHDLIIAGTPLQLGVVCGASTPPCGTCTITGVVPGTPLRCETDPATICTLATEVTDCGEPDRCRVLLGPPQSLGLGGVQLCVTQDLAGAISGTVNVETGAFAPIVPLHVRLYTGPSETEGCPRCLGDPALNDGVAGGTCEGGTRVGLPCDANATSTLSDFGSTSYDCPPAITPSTHDFDVGTIRASTTPQTRTLGATSPPCPGMLPTTPCFCSTCNNAAGHPCASNADCPLSGGQTGICGGRRCLSGPNNGAPCTGTSECPGGLCALPGEPPRPNACLESTAGSDECTPIGNGDGECPYGPVDTYCANHLNRGCTDDADCDGVPGACAAKLRRCFPDNGLIGNTVEVNGTATPPVNGVADPTDLGVLTCMGRTVSPFYDAAGGFPGLLRHVQPGRLIFTDETLATPTPIATPTATLTPIPGPCSAAPATCRAPFVDGKASVQLRDRDGSERDQLQWKWARGAATTLAELGDPVATDEYALCLYDASGLRATLQIPAGGTCDGKPCWRAKPTGFLYRNVDAAPHGITQLSLRSGSDGKASLQVKGKGALLPLPSLATLSGTLSLQLRNRASGLCWGTSFSPPFIKRTDELLKDTAD